MTTRDREYLRTKAAALAPAGCRVSQLLLWLLAEQEACEVALRDPPGLCDALAGRVAAQSEILSRLARRPVAHPCA